MKLVKIDGTNDLIDLDEVTNGVLKAWLAGLPTTDTEPLRLLAIQLDASGAERPVMHPAIASHIAGHGTGGRPLNRPINAENSCVLDNSKGAHSRMASKTSPPVFIFRRYPPA